MASEREIFNARSWLFAPGDSERKMEKATASAAGIVLLDLEDAVTEHQKPAARSMVSAFLRSRPLDRERLWVRINPLQSPHALSDLAAVFPGQPGGIMLPKSRGRADVEALDHYLSALEVAAGIERGSTRVIALPRRRLLFCGRARAEPLDHWLGEDVSGRLRPYGCCEIARFRRGIQCRQLQP